MKKLAITYLAAGLASVAFVVACELKIKKLRKEREAFCDAILEKIRFDDAKDVTDTVTVVS